MEWVRAMPGGIRLVRCRERIRVVVDPLGAGAALSLYSHR